MIFPPFEVAINLPGQRRHPDAEFFGGCHLRPCVILSAPKDLFGGLSS
jgi:hypothetical protein